jgi:hypothetical protein
VTGHCPASLLGAQIQVNPPLFQDPLFPPCRRLCRIPPIFAGLILPDLF